MTGEVVLSSALRNNLLSLQRTQSSIDKVQGVLATGLKVSSALDNPQSFFASQSLKNRSSDLTRLLDGIGQSIQTIKAADAGVTSLTKLVEQAQSIADSARDAITNGSKEAAVTGNRSLKGITDVAAMTGVGTNAEISFTYRAADATTNSTLSDAGGGAGTVVIASGDSIDQVITKINDITNASGEAVLKAELNGAGQLSVKALNGGIFTMAFDQNGTGAASGAIGANPNTQATDLAFASALGFGGQALATSVTGTTSTNQLTEISVTALANTKLSSGLFYNNGGTGFSDASDLLTAVDDSDGGGQVRFVGTTAANLVFSVNGTKTQSVAIAGTSIQGLVDGINNSTSIGTLVKASYDQTTGQFSIEAKDATVSTINVSLDGGTAESGRADFGFGTKTGAAAVGGATNLNVGETFIFASAASTLAQYEDDYNTIRTQIDELVEDSGYRGVNLLAGDTLDTYFNEDRSNKLSTIGSALDSNGLGLEEADFSRLETIEQTATEARTGLTALRSFGGTLSNSLSVIQTRENFTKTMVETLNEGSDKLTVADQNEEGAKLLALQTRQQLGVTALSLAAQAQQSVLRLF